MAPCYTNIDHDLIRTVHMDVLNYQNPNNIQHNTQCRYEGDVCYMLCYMSHRTGKHGCVTTG